MNGQDETDPGEMKKMFIKLTLFRGEKSTWLNVFKIKSITAETTHSNIWYSEDQFLPLEVKETPEEIIELISRMKK